MDNIQTVTLLHPARVTRPTEVALRCAATDPTSKNAIMEVSFGVSPAGDGGLRVTVGGRSGDIDATSVYFLHVLTQGILGRP